jgi:ribonuclease-3
VTPVEEIIGHAFRDPALLSTALTHPTWAHEHPGAPHYERLEHLGDAVLGLVVAEHLFHAHPGAAESELSRRRAAVVEGRVLSRVWQEHGLEGALRLGNGMAAHDSPASAWENAFEAVIGAVFLDGGIDAARSVVLRLLSREIAAGPPSRAESPKTELQNALQAEGAPPPRYVQVDRTGPDHDPVYTFAVSSEGAVLGTGTGRTRKKAEDAAASDALRKRADA